MEWFLCFDIVEKCCKGIDSIKNYFDKYSCVIKNVRNKLADSINRLE